LAGQPVLVNVEGQELEIEPDEVEVRAEARQGLVVAAEGAYLAALSIELSPELVEEGLAREFVRRVQDLRKQAELDIADRIRLYVQASPGLSAAILAQQEYIMGETLTVELALAQPPAKSSAPAATASAAFDGETVTFTILKR
jgi:isoleucyl-tRNA synthetase